MKSVSICRLIYSRYYNLSMDQLSYSLGDHIKEKCGIFGVFTKNESASRLIRAGLCSLQHRGQEATGMSVSDGEKISTHKGTGLGLLVFTTN